MMLSSTLKQGLILIVATWCAQDHVGLATFKDERGREGDSWPLARGDNVRTVRIDKSRLKSLTH
jgi:hypothetical protein